jgi:hypothetical protein
MKLTYAILIAAGCAFAAGGAGAATTDDVKWVNQCAQDNKGGASDEVVLKYCTCMNNKMSDNETQSITAWEKSKRHPGPPLPDHAFPHVAALMRDRVSGRFARSKADSLACRISLSRDPRYLFVPGDNPAGIKTARGPWPAMNFVGARRAASSAARRSHSPSPSRP